MKFWIGSNIKLPVRRLSPADLSLFDLNPEGGVGCTTLQDDAKAVAGPGGFIYEAEIRPSTVMLRNHRDFTVANFYAPLERMVKGSPDYAKVMGTRYGGSRQPHKALMKDLLAQGMIGKGLDWTYVLFYVTKRQQFSVDVSNVMGFDGRFHRIKRANLPALDPEHPGFDEEPVRPEKVFATIWNLSAVTIEQELPA